MSSRQGQSILFFFFFDGEDMDKNTRRVRKPHPEIVAFLGLQLPMIITFGNG